MNKTLHCMIVDDEPSAQEVLHRYAADTPRLEVVAVCDDAPEALKRLGEMAVDLLFLDINMPRLSGISMLRSLANPPPVILTTAYDDYALEGYELDVVDYLLKPFSFDRFLQAVRKAEERKGRDWQAEEFLMVKADRKSYKIDYREIRHIESLGDYVTVHSGGRKLTTYNSLKNLESVLPSRRFLRVHKSYMVSVDRVDYLEGNRLFVDGQEIPIGETYREEVRRRFGT